MDVMVMVVHFLFSHFYDLNFCSAHSLSAQVLYFGVKVNFLSWNVTATIQPQFCGYWV